MSYLNMVGCGDSLDYLKRVPSASVDSCVTDAPYGLGTPPDPVAVMTKWVAGETFDPEGLGGFMGKKWDAFVPQPELWKEVYRILKPGGYLLAFFGCYDDQTEVLTRDGWKLFAALTRDDWLPTLDPATGEIHYQRPEKLVRYGHHRKLHHFKTNKIDLMVTPNHRMLVQTLGRKDAPWRLVDAESVPKAVRMKKDGVWSGEESTTFTLPSVPQSRGNGQKPVALPPLEIPMDVWLAFFGLWLAEGSSSITKHKTGFGYNTSICHFNEENLDELETLLSPYFPVCRYPRSGKFRINGKQLAAYLQQFGKAWEKFVPTELKALSPRQLRILWDWYMRGDGCGYNGYTSSYRMAGDWQEIALKMGISADVHVEPWKDSMIEGRVVKQRRPHYRVRFNKRQNTPEVYSRRGKPVVKVVDYEGDVFCAEVPRFHTLYVRRNGKTAWCGNTRTFDWGTMSIRFAGFEVCDQIDWVYGSGFPKSHDIAKAIDKMLGAEREVIGRIGNHYATKATAKQGLQTRNVTEWDLTSPEAVTPEAKAWQGWGTAMKPSHEPVAVCRKPFDGNYAANVMEHGTGAFNIDASRIAGAPRNPGFKAPKSRGLFQGSDNAALVDYESPDGRWPANVVLSHLPGCELVGTKRVSTGTAVQRNLPEGGGQLGTVAFKAGTQRGPDQGFGDADGKEEVEDWRCAEGCPIAEMDNQSAGASRFFYAPKAAKKERWAYCRRCKLAVPHAGDLAAHDDHEDDVVSHPTQKPTALMEYLIRLVTQRGGVVVDPFCGTGTTAVAAKNLGYNFITCDLDPDYVAIAEARLAGVGTEAGSALTSGAYFCPGCKAAGKLKLIDKEAVDRLRESGRKTNCSQCYTRFTYEELTA